MGLVRMGLADVTARGVLGAVAEFDRLGREEFLRANGFGRARMYFLNYQGRRYDSKAIVGVAHGFDCPELGSLRAEDFSGGVITVVRCLNALGFHVDCIEADL